MADRFRGVITPILTPYNDDQTIATDLYLKHAAICLEGGAHYLQYTGLPVVLALGHGAKWAFSLIAKSAGGLLLD